MQKTYGSQTRLSNIKNDGKAVQRTAKKKWDRGVVYKKIADAFLKMLNWC